MVKFMWLDKLYRPDIMEDCEIPKWFKLGIITEDGKFDKLKYDGGPCLRRIQEYYSTPKIGELDCAHQ